MGRVWGCAAEHTRPWRCTSGRRRRLHAALSAVSNNTRALSCHPPCGLAVRRLQPAQQTSPPPPPHTHTPSRYPPTHALTPSHPTPLVYAARRYVVPKPKEECTKGEQLGVSFAAGYIAGVLCAVVSQPADNLVSKLNAQKGGWVGGGMGWLRAG